LLAHGAPRHARPREGRRGPRRRGGRHGGRHRFAEGAVPVFRAARWADSARSRTVAAEASSEAERGAQLVAQTLTPSDPAKVGAEAEALPDRPFAPRRRLRRQSESGPALVCPLNLRWVRESERPRPDVMLAAGGLDASSPTARGAAWHQRSARSSVPSFPGALPVRDARWPLRGARGGGRARSRRPLPEA